MNIESKATVAGLQITYKYIYIYTHKYIYIYIYTYAYVKAALCRQHWASGNAGSLTHRGRVNAMG